MIAMPDDDLHGRVADLESRQKFIDAWQKLADGWKKAVDERIDAIDRRIEAIFQSMRTREALDDERHSGNLLRFGKLDDHLANQDKGNIKLAGAVEEVLKNTQQIQIKMAGQDGAAAQQHESDKKAAEIATLRTSKSANRIAAGALLVGALGTVAAILTAVWALHK